RPHGRRRLRRKSHATPEALPEAPLRHRVGPGRAGGGGGSPSRGGRAGVARFWWRPEAESCYAAAMRRIGVLGLGLVLIATAAFAREKKGSATLARTAVPGRLARLAEIDKDATPPKPGSSKERAARKLPRPAEARTERVFGFR